MTNLEEAILDEYRRNNPELTVGGPGWCRVICAVKAAAAIVACAGNPVLIAVAVAAGIACAKECDG